MKKPEITPGKWHAMPMHQTEETIIFADNEEPQVAVVRWKCGVEDNRELANIKAITALPDLLESMEPLQGINDRRLRSMNADQLRELIWETRSLQMLSLTKAGYTFD